MLIEERERRLKIMFSWQTTVPEAQSRHCMASYSLAAVMHANIANGSDAAHRSREHSRSHIRRTACEGPLSGTEQ